MFEPAKVSDYMSRDLVTLSPEMEILRAVHILLANDIASAPVIDNTDQLVGILTERDCMQVVLNAGYHAEYGGQVTKFMSKNVETISANESIVDVAKLFFGERFHRYPVMQHNQLVGLISRRDVLRALGKLW